MDTGDLPCPEPVAADRMAMAREQSVLFPTRLALARWTCGSDIPHLYCDRSPSARASWYDQAQRDFQAWLERGGFTQYDDEAAVPTLADAPACDDNKHQADACIYARV